MHLDDGVHLQSDHLPLQLTLATSQPAPRSSTNSRVRWNHTRFPEAWQTALPWEMEMAMAELAPALQSLRSPVPNGVSPQQLLNAAHSQFESIFLRACTYVVGVSYSRPSQVRWWSYPGVQSTYQALLAERRRHRRNPAYQGHVAALAQWRAIQAEAKQHQWAELCNLLGSTPASPLRWP